jgi:protein gp37
MSVRWNPWHGCRKISEGCRHCYVYRQDARHGLASDEVRRTAAFDLPVRRSRDGRFRIPARETVYTCFTSDFLVEEADAWRAEAWEMIRLRHDLRFFFITKRIDRLVAVLPPDWGDGFEHVAVGCTVENQTEADRRLPLFLEAPLRHRIIIGAPLLGPLDLMPYLTAAIEEVSVGGESGSDARLCDYDWVRAIRDQCVTAHVPFRFHQTGARLLKEGRLYRIPRDRQHEQARKASIDYLP